MKKFRKRVIKRKNKNHLLEFQTRLLKGLAITSDSVRNWRGQIENVLAESSKVIGIYFAFIAFTTGDDRYDLDIFWPDTPSRRIREVVENIVKGSLHAETAREKIRGITTIHTKLRSSPLKCFTSDRLELRTKSFNLKTPKTKGFAGIGIKPDHKKDYTDLIVESILTSFVNHISSVLAITTYTRDIERFATRDPLTGLYNQAAFWDMLEYETQRSKRQQYRFSLLVIDIDNFKVINDTYGHEAGDRVIQDFAALLKAAVRKGDIPARNEGDKFSAILPVCDEEQAYIVAQRIIENLRTYVLTLPDGAQIRETVSIGIAVSPDHAKDAKDLFLLADNMLYQSKSFGKDRLSVPGEEDNAGVFRSRSEKNIMIMKALNENRVVPYFQPIMNVKEMKIVAYEVLTRIITSDRVIPAAEFIETAEGMGAIGKIDYRLMEQAFDKVKKIHYTGRLFLNLSPKVLMLGEFMPTVRKLLRDYDMDPSKMVFEITERDTVKNLNVMEKFIHDLKLEGFHFAIDDFGAGYSSFQYIKTFSIDYLKIDGEFIRNLVNKDAVEKAIVKSIVTLAEILDIKTIAEYVESEEILEEVESVGINFAQGYYIQKPSPDMK